VEGFYKQAEGNFMASRGRKILWWFRQ